MFECGMCHIDSELFLALEREYMVPVAVRQRQSDHWFRQRVLSVMETQQL